MRTNVAATRQRHSVAIVCALALSVWSRVLADETGSRWEASADLDGDGRIEVVRVDTAKTRTLSVWRDGRLLARDIPARWRPWKLAITDADGDGTPDIALGLRKATRFFPRPHNCLFLYTFDGSAIRPRWLGSSLSRPFTDFGFAPARRGVAPRLAAVERRSDGRVSVAVYHWNGFGYTLDWRSGVWRSATIVRVNTGTITLSADGTTVTVKR